MHTDKPNKNILEFTPFKSYESYASVAKNLFTLCEKFKSPRLRGE
jgi:hypothetical protein